MSLSAAVIDALVAAGATVEQLAAAMKADLAEGEARKEEKRAKDAERQRRHRASRNVTVTTRDNEVVTNGHVQKEKVPRPLKEKYPPLNGSPKGEPIPPTDPPLKPEHVVEAWNELAGRRGLPSIRKLTAGRQKSLRSFVRGNTIDEVKAALDAIERSSFLCGENDRGWRADFDFLLQPKSFTKLIEGAYDH